MFHIVLVEPEIPQNTGNIARTCAATGCELHLVHPLGFEISDKQLKRAGLDYWDLVRVHEHGSFEELAAAYPHARFFFFTTKAKHNYTEAAYREGDFPMIDKSRSLNLSNSAAIAVYEGLRQNGFRNLLQEGELHRLKW